MFYRIRLLYWPGTFRRPRALDLPITGRGDDNLDKAEARTWLRISTALTPQFNSNQSDEVGCDGIRDEDLPEKTLVV